MNLSPSVEPQTGPLQHFLVYTTESYINHYLEQGLLVFHSIRLPHDLSTLMNLQLKDSGEFQILMSTHIVQLSSRLVQLDI